jgi:3-methyladenine DNA glycosylase AlkD
MTLTGNEWYERTNRAFSAAGNPDYANKQSQYMKQKFLFYGLKAPQWTDISKEIYTQNGSCADGTLIDLVHLCYDDDHREMQYFALLMLQRAVKKQPETLIETLEYCITQKSWWDTVDWVAKLVGIHFLRFPHLIYPTTARWMASDNIWLQRVSIIFQLFYKQKTDTTLLFSYILRVAGSKEFFLQKAAGWALRQHTRTDADLVRAFVDEHRAQLSALTKKEALRLLG